MKNKRTRQQGSVKRSRIFGNKGSVMSGDDTSQSKSHRKVKKDHRQ